MQAAISREYGLLLDRYAHREATYTQIETPQTPPDYVNPDASDRAYAERRFELVQAIGMRDRRFFKEGISITMDVYRMVRAPKFGGYDRTDYGSKILSHTVSVSPGAYLFGNSGNNSVLQSNQKEGGEAKYFTNRNDAFDYMWKHSFNEEGEPIREVSAWMLRNGHVIVLPYNKNHLTSEGGAVSYNDALPVYKAGNLKAVGFKGKKYIIDTHIHTHPLPHKGFNYADVDMVNFVNRPIYILWDKKIFQFTNPTDYIDYGLWKK